MHFRHELRPLGIRVTSVMPGPTWSHSWEGVEFPENRLLAAEHVANAVLACLGAASRGCDGRTGDSTF